METTILFAVIVGCFVSLISIGVVPVMLKWMSTPDDVVGPAGEYLKIYFVGVPVLFLYNMGSAILRAVGDTRRPLLFLIISSCLNIVLDILFVRYSTGGSAGCGDRHGDGGDSFRVPGLHDAHKNRWRP